MNVRALLLVAGRGSRLGALGEDKPKCLAVLAGRTLLEWKLHALAAAGIGEVHALTGYKATALEGWSLPTIHNPRWAETNMVGTLLHGEALMRRPGRSLICYGDIVVHPDVLRNIASAEGDIVIPYDRRWLELWRARFADPLSDAETFRQEHGRLVEIGQRPTSVEEVGGQFMGLLAITPTGWDQLSLMMRTLPADAVDRLDTTSLLRTALAAGIEVRCLPVDGRWCEVDSAADLQRYEALLDAPGGWSHDWRWQGDGGEQPT